MNLAQGKLIVRYVLAHVMVLELNLFHLMQAFEIPQIELLPSGSMNEDGGSESGIGKMFPACYKKCSPGTCGYCLLGKNKNSYSFLLCLG